MTIKNLIGQRFGRLTVIELHHREQVFNKRGIKKGYKNYWLCKCECGNEKVIVGESLIANKTKSCGCFRNEKLKERRLKHGMSETKLNGIYSSMKRRCYNKNDKNYNDYGNRGITVCDEWKNNSKAFYNWALSNGYQEGLTIDRIDNNGNYEPSNCKWATMKEQSRHRRNSRLVEYNGKAQCISAWAEELGVREGLLRDRLRANWSIEKAFNTPVKNSKKK